MSWPTKRRRAQALAGNMARMVGFGRMTDAEKSVVRQQLLNPGPDTANGGSRRKREQLNDMKDRKKQQERELSAGDEMLK